MGSRVSRAGLSLSEHGGCLVVVGTPLGNLGDFSPRGQQALATADVIACEDSRRTGKLLSHCGVSGKRLIVVNDHTEVPQLEQVVGEIRQGNTVVLVSDAGMPTVSDPGRRLVSAVVEAGLLVEVVPGPTAAITALSFSGFSADRFVFEGFLPRKGVLRQARVQGIADELRTVVLYEAPHRLRRTLTDLSVACDESRLVVVGRELTKLHEEAIRGTLKAVGDHFAEVEPRGEFVVVLSGAEPRKVVFDDDSLRLALRQGIAAGLSRRDAVVEVVAMSGKPKRYVYELAVSLGEG